MFLSQDSVWKKKFELILHHSVDKIIFPLAQYSLVAFLAKQVQSLFLASVVEMQFLAQIWSHFNRVICRYLFFYFVFPKSVHLFQLLCADPFLVESSINRLLDIGTLSSNSLALTIMCHCLDDFKLTKHLLSAILKRPAFATYIQKSSSKQPVKHLHERITGAITNFVARYLHT